MKGQVKTVKYGQVATFWLTQESTSRKPSRDINLFKSGRGQIRVGAQAFTGDDPARNLLTVGSPRN